MPDQTVLFVPIILLCVLALSLLPACAAGPGAGPGGAGRFDQTLELIRANTQPVILSDGAGEECVVVAPAFAGRVMMSTWGGPNRVRLGWVNEPVVAGKERNPAFINYGGAERLWLSPEGGQFALFFEPGDPFDLDHWKTPLTFNSEPYEVVEKSGTRVSMARNMKLANYQGTPFTFRVLREVSIVPREGFLSRFNVALPPTVRFVGYTSKNVLVNRGYSKMTMEKGLVSLWVLCQFDATPGTWVVFPFKKDGEGGKGPLVRDDYFGKVPPGRLRVDEDLGCAFFHCDGRRRTKIGLSFDRAENVIGSMDFDRNILTVVTFNLPRKGLWAANTWEIQKEPFKGDVVNSYNNGIEGEDADVPECFYELETLSPVKELEPGHRIEHVNTVMHFGGAFEDLDAISRALLGVDLGRVRSAVNAPLHVTAPAAAGEEGSGKGAVEPRKPGGESRLPKVKPERRFK